MDTSISEVKSLIIAGQYSMITKAVHRCLGDGNTAQEILQNGMISAMNEVGVRFSESKIFLPEMMLSGKTMQVGMESLAHHLACEETITKGKVVISTVHGDLHDIGKNIVKLLLEGNGFFVVDLGVNVESEKILDAIKEHKPQVLMLSALLTTTISEMGNVIKMLEDNNIRQEVKVVVGGAPIEVSAAVKMGADAYGVDAYEAVTIAKRFVS